MKYYFTLLIAPLLLSCSNKENLIFYGDLPCAPHITEYKDKIIRADDEISYQWSANKTKAVIRDIQSTMENYDKAFFDCVWVVHQKRRNDFTETDRSTVMVFSLSIGSIQAANSVAIEADKWSSSDINLLKIVYSRQAELLNKARKNRPSD
ncbi:hypothetical protein [Pseudomaricurvus sp.]|uniref:hypothetical protein n=1 Tax=Pseudomaricurvus sp. TaxID=2004510 RepID=UPI003F6C9B98